MKEKEQERRVISIDAVRKVLLDMGLRQVENLTDEEIGENSLFDLGLSSHELPEFLSRIEKIKYIFLDQEAIIDFLVHSGYTITVYNLGEFSATHFSTIKEVC